MKGAFIANLSGKKFTSLIILAIIAQIICFFIGGLITPRPTMSQNILATACKNDGVNSSSGTESDKWYYKRGKGGCEIVDMFMYEKNIQDQVHQVVYAVQIPSPRNSDFLDHSKEWQQNFIALLHIDLVHRSQLKIAPKSPIVLDVKLAYRNKGDPEDAWKPYVVSRVERTLECSICDEKNHPNYDCMPIPLFELDLVHHDYYLLNIRFPIVESDEDINKVLGYMTDLWLTAIKQNGSFTKLYLGLKVIFFPIVISFLAWYWRRVHILTTSPTLLQCMLLISASTLSFLNMPLEYLTLYWNIPVMSFLNNVREGIFYAVLLSFLLIFVGEHLTIPEYDQHNNFIYYWRHLSAVFLGFFILFIFNILSKILAGLYLLFLTYMIWKIFIKVNIYKIVLPLNMKWAGRLHSHGAIYRYKFLMIATLSCGTLTIIEFILGQAAKSQWKHNEDYELETTRAFFIGVYGMWNIYITALLCLYAPARTKRVS